MKDHPKISPGDWIYVGSTRCVVTNVYASTSLSGVCMVVFNKHKPTTHDVDWNGKEWYFPQRPDFGGYGRDNDPFVQQLKRG